MYHPNPPVERIGYGRLIKSVFKPIVIEEGEKVKCRRFIIFVMDIQEAEYSVQDCIVLSNMSIEKWKH